MAKNLKYFINHSQYNTYINGNDKILPNISLCNDDESLYINPLTTVIVRYNVTSTESPTTLLSSTEAFTKMEIDGETIQISTSYTFSTTGLHVVFYTLNDPTIISGFENCDNIVNVVLPNTVTTIDDDAFSGCTELVSITLPETITSIGYNSFSECTSLTNISLPNGLTFIGSNAFFNCTSLSRIILPNTITTIDTYAFEGCSSITDIKIPSGLTILDEGIFNGCTGLLNVIIPDTIEEIGDIAFGDCTNLTSVVIGRSVISITDGAFFGCTNLTKVTLNSGDIVSNTYNSTSNIKSMFGNQVTEYVIGDNIGSIGNYAFYNSTNIEKIEIPHSVTSIGNSAFRQCSSLSSLSIPNSVTNIGSYAFQNCIGLKDVTLPNSLNTINTYTFSGCTSITSIKIPEGIASIGNYAFSNCTNLNYIDLPSSLISIGIQTFNNCTYLKKIIIPKNVNSISSSSFQNCVNIETIMVDDRNQTYDSRNNCNALIETSSNTLFFGCQNTIIPNTVEIIAQRAFKGCEALTSITIPDSVSTINSIAFESCTNLSNVTISSDNDIYIGSNAFNKTPYIDKMENGIIYIGKCCYMLKGEGSSTMEIENGITGITPNAFSLKRSLTSITIPSTVTKIGDSAFYSCPALANVTVNAITPPTLGSTVFDSNARGRMIHVPSTSVETYKRSWSSYSSSITSIT